MKKLLLCLSFLVTCALSTQLYADNETTLPVDTSDTSTQEDTKPTYTTDPSMMDYVPDIFKNPEDRDIDGKGLLISPMPIATPDPNQYRCASLPGTKWNLLSESCLTPGTVTIHTVHITPEQVTCEQQGVTEDCMTLYFGLSKRPITVPIDAIEGFTFREGTSIQMQILKYLTPRADQKPFVVANEDTSQTPEDTGDAALMAGSWRFVDSSLLSSSEKKDLEKENYTFRYNNGKVGMKICNSGGGDATIADGSISAPELFATKMYCEGLAGKIERAFNIDKAKYAFDGGTLTITTEKGDTFTLEQKKR